jgi:hypothetical protein
MADALPDAVHPVAQTARPLVQQGAIGDLETPGGLGPASVGTHRQKERPSGAEAAGRAAEHRPGQLDDFGIAEASPGGKPGLDQTGLRPLCHQDRGEFAQETVLLAPECMVAPRTARLGSAI